MKAILIALLIATAPSIAYSDERQIVCYVTPVLHDRHGLRTIEHCLEREIIRVRT